MRLISINVGKPREVAWKGSIVTTGIFKAPLHGPVRLHRHNLHGDAQADLTVHGGTYKAVYFYPSEHYEVWRRELPEMELPWGMFGENFTTEGMREENIHIGDRLGIGSAVVRVTQPRTPCHKLGLRFGRDEMIKRFLASRRTGFYAAVEREGEVEAGQFFELLEREAHGVTVADLVRAFVQENDDVATLRHIAQLPSLSPWWHEYFVARLAERGAQPRGDGI